MLVIRVSFNFFFFFFFFCISTAKQLLIVKVVMLCLIQKHKQFYEDDWAFKKHPKDAIVWQFGVYHLHGILSELIQENVNSVVYMKDISIKVKIQCQNSNMDNIIFPTLYSMFEYRCFKRNSIQKLRRQYPQKINR